MVLYKSIIIIIYYYYNVNAKPTESEVQEWGDPIRGWKVSGTVKFANIFVTLCNTVPHVNI